MTLETEEGLEGYERVSIEGGVTVPIPKLWTFQPYVSEQDGAKVYQYSRPTTGENAFTGIQIWVMRNLTRSTGIGVEEHVSRSYKSASPGVFPYDDFNLQAEPPFLFVKRWFYSEFDDKEGELSPGIVQATRKPLPNYYVMLAGNTITDTAYNFAFKTLPERALVDAPIARQIVDNIRFPH